MSARQQTGVYYTDPKTKQLIHDCRSASQPKTDSPRLIAPKSSKR